MELDLSIIILSYNTKSLTHKCISSLIKSIAKNKDLKIEIIVVDNGSRDGTVKMLKIFNFQFSIFKLILNKKNFGYPKGNNQALRFANGKYILFLNSDVRVDDVDFAKLIDYLNNHSEIGVLTVKVMLSDRQIDPASHRGFPTIWNSFCYFTRLEWLFKSLPVLNKFFAGYHLTHMNLNVVHEIDSPSGAFYLIRKSILDKLNGFDESFFMYGEDIDLSFRIKAAGYKIIYYPDFRVTHFKHASGLGKSDREMRRKTKHYFYEAMKIFYKKHYARGHPWMINQLVYFAIKTLKNLYA